MVKSEGENSAWRLGKPRTGPYSFQGHGEMALKLMKKAGQNMTWRRFPKSKISMTCNCSEEYVDIIQIGAHVCKLRSAQSPRNIKSQSCSSATGCDFRRNSPAAEYILAGGNRMSFCASAASVPSEKKCASLWHFGSVPALRELTHLPIIVDPSHAMGKRDG